MMGTMGTTMKRYDYRACPTGKQADALARQFGCCRFVYNAFIKERSYRYRHGGVNLTAVQFAKELTELKTTPDRRWLADVSVVPLQQAIRHADAAYRNFFRGCETGRNVGYPRFKSKHGTQSAEYTKSARFKIQHQKGAKWAYLTLPKVGRLKFRWSRDLPSVPKSVTVLKRPNGDYHVSFPVEAPILPAPQPAHEACGIDLGVASLAVVRASDGTGYTVEHPRLMRHAQRKLSRLQRKLSRQKKGSNRYRKTRHAIARTHQHMRDKRLDLLTKTAKQVTDENQAVALETLSVKNMVRRANPKPGPDRPGQWSPNRRKAKAGLNRSILDAGWGTLVRLIEQMGMEKGRDIRKIGRWAATSQTCCVCHTRDGRKPLAVREWDCPTCGAHLDRDANAAVNIMLAAGLAESLNARGGAVNRRLAQANLAGNTPMEAGTHRTVVLH
ncbi:transposase, IS605 family [Bifidobacterium gallicum DSM 20093 = LMG 11596]|uniref:Transposase, IS605 family n=2 Tax=Bifidobacterium gallicum DSM 20093 = LMG 11596 TaxID=561180 RepID=D1NU83_9BIFI|nr:transposase, IS605 family [Bifidobacterium gallicum DSM 20093 = LMG 11596]